MKIIITLVVFALLIGCKTTNNHYYTITKIEQGKDGKTLLLKDAKNKIYTTVISIPNGNYANVGEGDKIQLEIVEVLEANPPMIISKSIKVIERPD